MIHLVELFAKSRENPDYITESAKKLDDSSIMNKTYVDKNGMGVAKCK